MDFSVEVGSSERSIITYRRDAFWGTEPVLGDGDPSFRRGFWNLSTHFSLSLTRTWAFTVGARGQHAVVIEKKRPLWVAGARPHTYRVIVDGRCVFEKSGF